jgi:alpha-1,2-mannosyltransferase
VHDDNAGNTRAALRWVVLALLVAGIVYAHLWYGNRHKFYDLEIYREAVNWWRHGHDLYSFAKPDATQGELGFTYPPFGAVVLVPFAVLPKGLAIGLYTVLMAAAVPVTTWWLLKPVARRHGWPILFAMVLALTLISTLEPMRETYTFGQINVFLAIGVLFDLLVLLPRNSRWTGICVGLAAAVKLTPAIFIVYLLVSRRYRAALVSAASAVGASLVAAAIAPKMSWEYWTDTLWHGQGLGNAAYTFNQSIYAMLARFSAPAKPNSVLWLALVLVAVVFGLWRARKAALAGDEVTGLTIAGLVGCLASPITWAHHLYWFVPALVVLVDVGRKRTTAFAALIVVTVGLGMVSWFEQGLPAHPWGDGVPGFLIKNWYLLLSAALVAVLPIRRGATGAPADADTARGRSTEEAAAVR